MIRIYNTIIDETKVEYIKALDGYLLVKLQNCDVISIDTVNREETNAILDTLSEYCFNIAISIKNKIEEK